MQFFMPDGYSSRRHTIAFCATFLGFGDARVGHKSITACALQLGIAASVAVNVFALPLGTETGKSTDIIYQAGDH